MNTKPMWVMTVPVISTQHMPNTDSLGKLSESCEALCAIYDEGGFVLIPFDPMDEAMWTAPIRDWLRENFANEDVNWVRFDCDAEVIEGIPTYEWSES